MEVEFKGGNCVVINNKKDTFVTDPNLSSIGLKDQGADATVQLLTQERFKAPASEETLVLSGPGEYEIHNCSVQGIAAKAHVDPDNSQTTIFTLEIEGVRFCILGHIAGKLDEDQQEAIGMIDVLIVPVGGRGYSLEPKEAVAVVRDIDPKIVIPTHYDEEGVTYEVPQIGIEEFLTELAAPIEVSAKLKLKAGQIPEQLTVQHLTRSK